MNSRYDQIPPSPQQARVYNFMAEFFRENDQLPPTRTIQMHFGWSSQTAAMSIINALARKGWIERNETGKYRFVRPIQSFHES